MKTESGVKIDKKDGNFSITFEKKYLQRSSRQEIRDVLTILTSKLFLPLDNDDIVQKEREIPEVIDCGDKENIVIFMEMLSHYTGGRYSIFHQAVILGESYNVDVVVNAPIKFKDDFKDYPGFKNVKIIIDSDFLSKSTVSNEYKLVVGIPNVSAEYAYIYAQKHNLKFICYMFESPNYVSEYKDGVDSTESFWHDFKKVISKADVRLSPSIISSEYLKKWIGDNGNYKVIYPSINTLVAKRILEDDKIKETNDICYVSRMSSHKNPFPVLKILDRNQSMKITVHLVGKTWDKQEENYHFKNLNVIYHGAVNDEEKFKIIKSCRMMIFPSKFEGYGMPPMEALYFGKPVVAYRLPVLEEVYGGTLNYVDGGPKEFAREVVNVLSKLRANDMTMFNLRVPTYSEPFYTKEKLLEAFKYGGSKVSVGIIAFNAMDYLPYVISSIYNYVDQILIVEGAVKAIGKNNTRAWHSTDGTYEWLTNEGENCLYDPSGKVTTIVTSNDRPWADKIEMQNQIATRVTGDIYIKMDSDEIWDTKNLLSVINYMNQNKNIDCLRMPFCHLWTSFNYQAKDAGGKWSTKHPRVWRWRKGFRHIKSFNYFVDTKMDHRNVTDTYYKFDVWDGDPIYHFGYVRKKQRVDEKLYYYKARGIEKVVNMKVYDHWRNIKDPTQPTQSVRSWAELIDKNKLPVIMRKHPYWDVDDVRVIL